MAESVECQACKNKGDPIMKTCSSCGGALIKTVDTIKPEKIAKWLLLLVVVALSVILIIIALYRQNFGSLSIEPKHWGEFGDYFGGTLNPILSFLSLIALLFTIVLQSKELELTRDELKRSADAQAATKEVLDKQSETLARQQFESTFFSLLDQHNKALEQITNNSIREQLTSQEDMNVLKDANYLTSGPISAIKFIYLRILMSSGYGSRDLVSAKKNLESYNSHCGHYFRVLYQLLKFIAINVPGGTIGPAFTADKIQNEKLSDDEKMYSNIVRSFLGYEITQLLSINCYCTDESDTYWKYRLLIERYSFLEHMPLTVNNRGTHEILVEVNKSYKRSAFDNSNFAKKYE